MNRLVRQCVIAFVASAFACGAAQAQLFRAYLSVNGSDANPCTVSAPCRLLPAALAAVAEGGEVWMLDSANFNASSVTIAKSVTVLAVPGAVGSVVAVDQNPAITISGDVRVGLHNLVVTQLATAPPYASRGIVATNTDPFSSIVLAVEDCAFMNLRGGAIFASGTLVFVDIKNSLFRSNGYSVGAGLFAVRAENGPTITIANSQFLGNARGVLALANAASQPVNVSITDSSISGRGYAVLASADGTSALARIFVTRSTIQHAQIGAWADSSTGVASITLSNSTITDAQTGYSQTGTTSVVKSLGNNYIDDNGTN